MAEVFAEIVVRAQPRGHERNELPNGLARLHFIIRHHIAVGLSLDPICDQSQIVERQAHVVENRIRF